MLQLLAGHVAIHPIADDSYRSRPRPPDTLGHQLRDEVLTGLNIPGGRQHGHDDHAA